MKRKLVTAGNDMVVKEKFIIFFIVVLAVILFVAFRPPEKINRNFIDISGGSICRNITTAGEKYFCLAVVNVDDSFCMKMDAPENRNMCIAILNKNISYCRKIMEPDAKKNCYYELVLINENIDYCDELENRMHCYFSFVNHLYWRGQREKIKPEYCDKFPDADPDKADCWAYYWGNVSMCGDDPTCLTCFEQPLSFCDNITFKEEADCIRDRALSSHNPDICEKIRDSYMRDDCYMDYSNHVSSDASLCEKIENTDLKNMCYLEIAIREYSEKEK